MPATHSAALSAHLQASSAAIQASPFNILLVFWNFLTSLAGGLVATQDERDSLAKMVMGAYDAEILAMSKLGNVATATAFMAARPIVQSGVIGLINLFAPAPQPAPPIPVPVPQPPVGAHP